tara:strand:- start:182 stop:331 length:150 start_codon:yes stop_codon:yes gene_type:complete
MEIDTTYIDKRARRRVTNARLWLFKQIAVVALVAVVSAGLLALAYFTGT